MYWRDEWPVMEDGSQYDGKELLRLVRGGKSPFAKVWNVENLIQEIEEKLVTQVTEILIINKGSNNYGFHLKTFNGPDLVARLARGDVSMPDFDGFPVEEQAAEAKFEAAVYELLRSEANIQTSRLLYYRMPRRNPGPRFATPQDLTGRRLFVFERAEGVNNVWEELNLDNQLLLLNQLAGMRAALFKYNPPLVFSTEFLHKRLFKFKPESFSVPVAPTREFWLHVFESKIKATIRNEGDMIGWESDNEVVGPVALMAKQSLLRALPHLLPPEDAQLSLYRLVLEHGDFGIHNTSITINTTGEPLITSLYDWETGSIAPALLSDPLVAVGPVDLVVEEVGGPSVTRLPESPTADDLEQYATWARHYIKILYENAPEYESVIKAGKDARHLWFTLRDWRGGNAEEFFGTLGAWTEKRLKEIMHGDSA